MNGPLLTAREVAGLLGVSTGALLRWTRAGKVPGALKLPSGAIRYRPERIEAWITDDCAMAGGAPEEVSPAPDTARRGEVSSVASPVPLDSTQEDRDAQG